MQSGFFVVRIAEVNDLTITHEKGAGEPTPDFMMVDEIRRPSSDPLH